MVHHRDAPEIFEFRLPGDPEIDGIIMKPRYGSAFFPVSRGPYPVIIFNHGGGMYPEWCEYDFGGIDHAQAGFVQCPMFLAHGMLDSTIPVAAALEFKRLLEAEKTPVELLLLEEGGHHIYQSARRERFGTLRFLRPSQKRFAFRRRLGRGGHHHG